MCAMYTTLVGAETEPVYMLNFGWFVIACVACVVLLIKARIRNTREEKTRRDRLRDYNLLNDSTEASRLTDFEEELLIHASKRMNVPKGFIEAAKSLHMDSLPQHLQEFMDRAKQSAEKPTPSETMFLRRSRRIAKRITSHEELSRVKVA